MSEIELGSLIQTAQNCVAFYFFAGQGGTLWAVSCCQCVGLASNLLQVTYNSGCPLWWLWSLYNSFSFHFTITNITISPTVPIPMCSYVYLVPCSKFHWFTDEMGSPFFTFLKLYTVSLCFCPLQFYFGNITSSPKFSSCCSEWPPPNSYSYHVSHSL